MRTFIAITLPTEIRNKICVLRDQLRTESPKASWVRTENYHVTVRFLGDLDKRAIDRLCAFLQPALREVPPFSLQVRGAGAFPKIRNPKVLWVRLETTDKKSLGHLHRSIEAGALHIGLPPDDHSFHPHITLARIRRTRTARQEKEKAEKSLVPLLHALENTKNFNGGEFTVESVSLFQSKLASGGPTYRCLQELSLQCHSYPS